MQYLNQSIYANITDEEWVEKITSVPSIQPLHRYFFKVKCASFLNYIALNVYNDCMESILGEFYEFISSNDWHVLRNYKKINNASLSTYLSRCSLYYFIKKKKNNKEAAEFYCLDNDEIIKQLEKMTDEEPTSDTRVWKAYSKLNERDRKVIRRLIIEEKKSIDIADEIWPYVNSKEKNWHKLPVKRVQDTIAMMKRRALFELVKEIRLMPS
jgi:hypothetical protein